MQKDKIVPFQTAKEAGLSRFFDGRACRAGHVAERYVSTRGCVECARLSAKAHLDAKKNKATSVEKPADQRYWEHVGSGRYAIDYNGHTLWATRNPNPEDPKRFIAVVDRVPLSESCWSLADAKKKAVAFVKNANGDLSQKLKEAFAELHANDEAEASPVSGLVNMALHHFDNPPDEYPEEFSELFSSVSEESPQASPKVSEVQVQEPEKVMADPSQQSMAVAVISPPDTANATQVQEGVQEVVAHIKVTLRSQSVVASLSSIQASIDMLREIADVVCDVELPGRVRL